MRLFSFFLIFGIAFGMNAQSQHKAYTFDHQLIDLGEITKGEQITGSFSFLNSGNEVLKIELVSSCDCTTIKWPRKGIAPGESGEISFIFDSSKKEVEEDIDIDVYFENIDPNTGAPYFEILQYKYQFKKD